MWLASLTEHAVFEVCPRPSVCFTPSRAEEDSRVWMDHMLCLSSVGVCTVPTFWLWGTRWCALHVRFLCGPWFAVLSGACLGVEARGRTRVHECAEGPGVRMVLAAGSLLRSGDEGRGFSHRGAEGPGKAGARVVATIHGRGRLYFGYLREARPCSVVLVWWCVNTLVRRPSHPGLNFVARVLWALPPGPQTYTFLPPPRAWVLLPGMTSRLPLVFSDRGSGAKMHRRRGNTKRRRQSPPHRVPQK